MKNSLLSSRLYDNKDFYKKFKKDLQSARHSVIIESPFITSRRMDDILPTLRELRKREVQIVVNTRCPEEHDYEFALQAVDAVTLMQEVGVIVLYTGKHHRKLAILDNEILWEGSLNILSQNESCEVMRRIKSKELALQMIKFVGIDKVIHLVGKL